MRKPTKRAPQKAAGTEGTKREPWLQHIKRDWTEHPLYNQWLRGSDWMGVYHTDAGWIAAINQQRAGDPEELIKRLFRGEPISPWIEPRLYTVLRRALGKNRVGRPSTPTYEPAVVDEWLDYLCQHVDFFMKKKLLSEAAAIEQVCEFWSSKPHTLRSPLAGYRGGQRGSAQRHKAAAKAARERKT